MKFVVWNIRYMDRLLSFSSVYGPRVNQADHKRTEKNEDPSSYSTVQGKRLIKLITKVNKMLIRLGSLKTP